MEHSKDPWLGQSTNDIQGITVPSLLSPSLPYMVVHMMAEGAIVSHGPVLMRLRLMRCCSGLSDGGEQKSMTSGELRPRKSSAHWVWKSLAFGAIPGDGTEVRRGNTYGWGESRRGEER
jgi:hypothetical protein